MSGIQVCQPKPYSEVIKEIMSGPRAELETCQAFLANARSMVTIESKCGTGAYASTARDA